MDGNQNRHYDGGMAEPHQFYRLRFPCPGCDSNVADQVVRKIWECPQCGAKLPDVSRESNPLLAWERLTGKLVSPI
jgi:ribosomal protein L37AE/L43A